MSIVRILVGVLCATCISAQVITTVAGVGGGGSGVFVLTGSLNSARYGHTATLLNNGMVLIAGGSGSGGISMASAELYDPATRTFTPTGSLNTARSFHTATLLGNGMVLIAGGSGSSVSAGAELYNPATGTFTVTGPLNTARFVHTATLLNNGMVLIAGGYNFLNSSSSALASSELYNPATGTFALTGSLHTARSRHTATPLNNGMVLIAGGSGSSGSLAGAELYNPATGTFAITGSLHTARYVHTATLLNNGMVLIAGGSPGTPSGDALAGAELYNSAPGTFTITGSLNTARYLHTATRLNDGTVVMAGGISFPGSELASAELYNPPTGTFDINTITGSLNTARYDQTATLLNNGMALIAGGEIAGGGALAGAELYVPGGGVPAITPGGVVDSASFSSKPLSPGGIFSIFGTNLAASTSQAATLPLPASLGGTIVIAGGIRAPLYFVSQTQINAMLPYELNPGTPYQIIVSSGDALTTPVTIAVAATDPGILAYGQNQNQAIAVDVNGLLIGPSNPTHAGDPLVMYCLGLGAVTPAVADGEAAPSNPPAKTVNPVTVEVGTQTANVFFAGLTPTQAGLYQINFFVPQGTATGEVPVTAAVGGVTSAVVNLSLAIASQCTPTKLLITPSNLTFTGSSLTSGLPIALNVSVADDCGNAINNAQVVATFSNGDSPVVLSSAQNGKYAGTWQPRNVQSLTQVTVQFSAQSASLSSTPVNPAVQ